MSDGPQRPPYRIDPQRVVLTPERIHQIESTRRFFERLRRRPLVSWVLLGVMVVFWVLTLVLAGLREPTSVGEWLSSLVLGSRAHQNVLVDLGAKVNFLIEQGQLWRLVAPLFLHFGLLHMLFNGYALYLLGRLIENLYGRRRFLLIFFFSGVLSIVASYLGTEHISVGASGALFGLLGAGTVVGYKHRDEIPPIFRRFFGRGLLPWIFLNLALGFVIDGIDNYAHIGGLIAGGAVALLLQARINPNKPEPRANRIGLTLLAGAIVLVFGGTIFVMIANLVSPEHLGRPTDTKPVSSVQIGVSARVPAAMKNIDPAAGDELLQYGEPNFGFWLELKRLPETELALDDLLPQLMAEVETEPDFKLIGQRDASLAGYAARRISIRIVPENAKQPYILEFTMAPTPTGLLQATCSAPAIHYPIFTAWCDAFIDSVRPYEALR